MICMMRSQYLFMGALAHTIKGKRLRYIWAISTWRFTKARQFIVPDRHSRFDAAAQAYNRGQIAVLKAFSVSLFGFALMHLMARVM